MAKDNSSLADSRKIRAMLEERWGGIPSSVMRADWGKKAKDLTKTYEDQKKENGYFGTAFSLSGVGPRSGGLSRFPQSILWWTLQFYCPEGGTVVDPFAGHISRLEGTYRSGRNYIGFDICHRFMELNRQRIAELYEENARQLVPATNTVTLHETDSRRMLEYMQPNIADFCITSPPFHNIEKYGPEPEQLGNLDYNGFLRDLGIIVANCYEALKPGAYCAWEVNDFRKGNVFYTYHSDAIGLFRQAGFKLHDVIIIDYGSGFLQAFASQIEQHKIVSKEHAYLIVGQKPTDAPKKDRDAVRQELLAETSVAPKLQTELW